MVTWHLGFVYPLVITLLVHMGSTGKNLNSVHIRMLNLLFTPSSKFTIQILLPCSRLSGKRN
jgi:hypothetical protein